MRGLVIVSLVLVVVATALGAEDQEHEELRELLRELKTAKRLTHTQRLRELAAEVKDKDETSPDKRFWFIFNKLIGHWKPKPKPKPVKP